MEFTTHLELQSQTTRLVDVWLTLPGERESHPLCCPVPRDLARPIMSQSTDHNSAHSADSHPEHFPLQSPLLRESWLVSFPPLNYMLKFGGSSCLIWDPEWIISCAKSDSARNICLENTESNLPCYKYRKLNYALKLTRHVKCYRR